MRSFWTSSVQTGVRAGSAGDRQLARCAGQAAATQAEAAARAATTKAMARAARTAATQAATEAGPETTGAAAAETAVAQPRGAAAARAAATPAASAGAGLPVFPKSSRSPMARRSGSAVSRGFMLGSSTMSFIDREIPGARGPVKRSPKRQEKFSAIRLGRVRRSGKLGKPEGRICAPTDFLSDFSMLGGV